MPGWDADYILHKLSMDYGLMIMNCEMIRQGAKLAWVGEPSESERAFERAKRLVMGTDRH